MGGISSKVLNRVESLGVSSAFTSRELLSFPTPTTVNRLDGMND